MIRIDEQSRKWWILAALAAAGGKLGDAIGQKVLFVVVVALFGLASWRRALPRAARGGLSRAPFKAWALP